MSMDFKRQYVVTQQSTNTEAYCLGIFDSQKDALGEIMSRVLNLAEDYDEEDWSTFLVDRIQFLEGDGGITLRHRYCSKDRSIEGEEQYLILYHDTEAGSATKKGDAPF